MLLTREQLQERLIALHRASLELVQDVSLETLLERIASTALEQVDANYAAVGVLDDEGKLKQFITVGMAQQEIERIGNLPCGLGLIGELMDTKDPIRVPVIKEDSRSAGFPPHHPEMIAFLGVPIRAGDIQLGQVYLTKDVPGEEFSADDERIIQMLAAYAATAIQNARLYENSQRLAVLEERDRIGMDLHDGIIQSIYGVGLSLDNALHTLDEDGDLAKVRIKESIDGLNQVIRDLRSYILDLRPRQMGDDGLMSGLRRLAKEYRANTLADVFLKGPEKRLAALPQVYSRALFHICQEALANAGKHAGAKRVEINLWMTDERAIMEIRDNGKGFAVEKMTATIGHGLANMHSRARAVGGDIEITSTAGDGTTILAWVPCNAKH